jgi:hypothetical protein
MTRGVRRRRRNREMLHGLPDLLGPVVAWSHQGLEETLRPSRRAAPIDQKSLWLAERRDGDPRSEGSSTTGAEASSRWPSPYVHADTPGVLAATSRCTIRA